MRKRATDRMKRKGCPGFWLSSPMWPLSYSLSINKKEKPSLLRFLCFTCGDASGKCIKKYSANSVCNLFNLISDPVLIFVDGLSTITN